MNALTIARWEALDGLPAAVLSGPGFLRFFPSLRKSGHRWRKFLEPAAQ
jgi:hypothetical protein